MNKLILFTCLLVSAFTLSSCTQTDQVKTKVLDKVVEVQNKVNDKIDQKVTDEKSELTDEQLLNQLNTDDTGVDADLNALETELK
jgi:hypothetical protein